MREYVLPKAGYVFDPPTGDWINFQTLDRIPDTDVEKHHLRLVTLHPELRSAAMVIAGERAKSLFARLN